MQIIPSAPFGALICRSEGNFASATGLITLISCVTRNATFCNSLKVRLARESVMGNGSAKQDERENSFCLAYYLMEYWRSRCWEKVLSVCQNKSLLNLAAVYWVCGLTILSRFSARLASLIHLHARKFFPYPFFFLFIFRSSSLISPTILAEDILSLAKRFAPLRCTFK